jgi:diacylglycerol kinase (ATP)
VTKEKIAFIINPKSGRRKKVNLEEKIFKNLDLEIFVPSLHYTSYPRHAYKLACQLAEEGYSKIVAVGGDGTVNEVAGAASELDIALGIIPTGSGNGLARHLGISTHINRAINNLNSYKIKRIDVGKINNKWFFCTCGVGFDAHIGRRFSKVHKRGFVSYIRTVIREYRRYKPKKYSFRVDGKQYTRKALLITIANASQYGNNAYIAPEASIDDGLFDVGIINPFPAFKALLMGIRLFNGSLQYSKYHEVIRGKEIIFKKPKKKYIFHYDGEPKKFKKGKIKICIYPKQLKVLVPAG